MEKQYVQMKAEIGIVFDDKCFDLKNASEEGSVSISVGGFYATIDGIQIPFDFEAYSYLIHNNTICYKTGEGLLFEMNCIDDSYLDEYQSIGIGTDEISAEFLAAMTILNDINLVIEDDKGDLMEYHHAINRMTFCDENGTEYEVLDDVLDSYNEIQLKKYMKEKNND